MQLLFKSCKAVNSQGSSPSLPVLAPYLACLTPIPYLPYSHTLPALFPYLFCLTQISFLPYSHTLPALLPCLACHTPLPCLFYLVSSLLTPTVSSLLSPVVGGSPSSTLTIDLPPAYPPRAGAGGGIQDAVWSPCRAPRHLPPPPVVLQACRLCRLEVS
jgi:hypothetical protein